MVPKGPRADRVGLATEGWRIWAAESFRQIGRGGKARCARATGVQQGVITKTIAGTTSASDAVPKITKWLEEQGFENPYRLAQMYITDLLREGDRDALNSWLRAGRAFAREKK